LVDYGSGKGRLLFYAHHRFHMKVIGVEKDRHLHEIAKKNKAIYGESHPKGKSEIILLNQSAEDYEVHREDTIFYFFNPFSLSVFDQVLQKIQASRKQDERDLTLIFYYPRQKYIDYLLDTAFEIDKEILIPGLSRLNPDERLLVYRG